MFIIRKYSLNIYSKSSISKLIVLQISCLKQQIVKMGVSGIFEVLWLRQTDPVKKNKKQKDKSSKSLANTCISLQIHSTHIKRKRQTHNCAITHTHAQTSQ